MKMKEERVRMMIIFDMYIHRHRKRTLEELLFLVFCPGTQPSRDQT